MSYIQIENYIVDSTKIKKIEEITIPELRQQDKYLSALTSQYKDIRKGVQKQGIKNTKFLETKYIPETGSIQFLFLSEATEEGDNKMKQELIKKEYDPVADKLIDNPSHTYTEIIQLDNIIPNSHYNYMSWVELHGENNPITTDDLKKLFETMNIKLWSSDPSFQFQGFNFRLTSKEDASIYPENRPDKHWRKIHGANAYLTKHLAQLLDSGTFELFLNQMVNAFNNKLRELGYVKTRSHKKKE
jgi:hypothetical protein